MTQNRWLVAAAATVAMACLGTVYSWSVFTQPLIASFGWSNTTTTWTFAIAIFSLGVGSVVGGRLQQRHGSRAIAVSGLVIWGIGNILAGLFTRQFGEAWIYLSYGVIGGFGCGLGYIVPVAAVTRWFPDKRGLGSGLVVMGFGLGAFFYNNIVKAVPPFAAASREAAKVIAARAAGTATSMSPQGAQASMTILLVSGIVYLVLGGLSAMLVRDPPAGYARAATGAKAAAPVRRDYATGEAMRTPQFWSLWFMLFLNVCAGILFISNAVPIMRELTGATPAAALGVYGFIALFNGLGRFFWGAVSDRIGRNAAYVLIYGLQVVIFFFAGSVHSMAVVGTLFAVVLLCYGGGFGTMPSFAADYFGTRFMGAIYGVILLAWGAGGIVGPIFVALVKDHTGSFSGALPIMGVLLVATILPLITRRPSGTPRPTRGAALQPAEA